MTIETDDTAHEVAAWYVDHVHPWYGETPVEPAARAAAYNAVSAAVVKLAGIDESYAMRRLVLRAIADGVERALAERVRLQLPHPDRLTCLVAAVDEASAYWALQINPHAELPPTPAEYRQIAADTLRHAGEMLPGLLADVTEQQEVTR